MHGRRMLAAGLSVALAGVVSAQFTNRSSVLDGSGTIASGGVFTNLSAAGQPGGIAVSSGGSFVNQAGFLNTFFLKPGLDTDRDGIADEADLDNDGDQLADETEIGGSAFAPYSVTLVNVADTDGDGVLDGGEAAAGTDPNDANARFELVAITNGAGQRHVAWRARGNSQRTYVVVAQDGSYTGSLTQVLFSNTLAGGSAPWYSITNSLPDAAAPSQRTYTVRVHNP